jgi:hypothetical protein
VQIREQIREIRALQHISKRGHHLAALDDLLAHLGLFQCSANAREVGTLVTARISDSVAMGASAFSKNRRAMNSLAAG